MSECDADLSESILQIAGRTCHEAVRGVVSSSEESRKEIRGAQLVLRRLAAHPSGSDHLAAFHANGAVRIASPQLRIAAVMKN